MINATNASPLSWKCYFCVWRPWIGLLLSFMLFGGVGLGGLVALALASAMGSDPDQNFKIQLLLIFGGFFSALFGIFLRKHVKNTIHTFYFGFPIKSTIQKMSNAPAYRSASFSWCSVLCKADDAKHGEIEILVRSDKLKRLALGNAILFFYDPTKQDTPILYRSEYKCLLAASGWKSLFSEHDFNANNIISGCAKPVTKPAYGGLDGNDRAA